MKYKLTNNKKTVCGVELTQIECIETFVYASKGDLGGWIEKETNLYDNAWVSDNACVSGNAQVSGNAWVSGNAQVSGNARVSGNAWVYDNAWVSDNACVSGNAQVSGNAWVSGKMNYTKGWFIGGDDSGKITDITDKTGSTYWKNQYVLGDYEITPIKEKTTELQKKELTLQEIADKFGIAITDLRIKGLKD